MHSLLILLALLVFAYLLRLRPRDFDLACEHLVGKLPFGQLEAVEPFVNGDRPDYLSFVQAIGGYGGIIRMWRNMTIYMRIVQLFYSKGRIKKADAAHVWVLALCETLFTMVSGVEFAVWRFVPWFPLVASIEAVRFHRDVVYRTDTLCSMRGAPECIRMLPKLL